jgi:2-polyprenyl-3-methyl-5-hydroxy-6-metoxy-1,4-benzoquinol methylase
MSVRGFYDALAPRYDAVRFATPYARLVDGLERAFIGAHCHPGSVLELGAGTGRLTTTLAALAARVTVVDESERMLAALGARLNGTPNVRARRMSLFGIEALEDFGRFDSVVCFRVLPHVEDTERALSLIQRALRPGGTAIFDLWNSRSAAFALRTLARRGRVYTRFLSPRRMRDAITGAGLTVEACRGWGVLIPFRVLQDRLDDDRVVRLFNAVERLGCTRLRAVAHALMFACVKGPGPSS